jgi:hypothetical protein
MLALGFWLMRPTAVSESTACEVQVVPEPLLTVVGAVLPSPVPWVRPALMVTSLPFTRAPLVTPCAYALPPLPPGLSAAATSLAAAQHAAKASAIETE